MDFDKLVESICCVDFNLCVQHPCVNQQSHLLPNNAFVFILASLPHIVLTTASMFTLEGGMTLLPTLLLMFGKEAKNWLEKKPTLIHVTAGGDWSCCKRCQEYYFFLIFGKETTNWPEKKSVPMHVKAAVENDLVFNVAKNITFLCLVTSQHIDLKNSTSLHPSNESDSFFAYLSSWCSLVNW